MSSFTQTKRPSLLGEVLGPFWRRFVWASAYFVAILLVGTVGYRLIERWDWFSSFYMAVTTVSSVGFMEVEPLSPGGRAFTMLLIVFAVTGLGIWWGLTTALIVELDLGGLLRRRRIMKKVSDLTNHFIVCGGGRMGRVVVEELYTTGKPFVVIERASGLAACLTDDGENLLLCLTARGMRADMTIVARAAYQESLDKLRRAGADHVMSPIVTGGLRIASMLLRPSVVSYLDVATTGADEMALRLEETDIPESSSLVGRSLAEAKIPQRTGLIVMSVRHRRGGSTATHNPGPETRLEAGDVLIVLGRQEQAQQLRDYIRKGR